MRIANQSKPSTIFVRRRINLFLTNVSKRKDDLASLARKCRCFKRHSIAVALIGKVDQHLTFDGRIRIRHNLVILRLIISQCQIKLILNQLIRLLRKKLGRDGSGHSVPIAFFFELIDGGKMFLAIRSQIFTLTICLNGGTKRIIGVIFDGFENCVVF